MITFTLVCWIAVLIMWVCNLQRSLQGYGYLPLSIVMVVLALVSIASLLAQLTEGD